MVQEIIIGNSMLQQNQSDDIMKIYLYNFHIFTTWNEKSTVK